MTFEHASIERRGCGCVHREHAAVPVISDEDGHDGPVEPSAARLLRFCRGVSAAQAQDADLAVREAAAVPELPLKAAHFGEVHVHTSYSLNTYIGGARLTPSDAYRFARGRTTMINGRPHNIVRPLDSAAVSDHAEFLGEMYSAQVEGAPGHNEQALEDLRNLTEFAEQDAWFKKYAQENMRGANPSHPPFYRGPRYHLVWSGDRAIGVDGKVPAVGNTVDLATADYTNEIGAPELVGHWPDDAFDPARPSLYYVRVLEIPTPRWSTYDAVRSGLPLREVAPAVIQERARASSPIRYVP